MAVGKYRFVGFEIYFYHYIFSGTGTDSSNIQDIKAKRVALTTEIVDTFTDIVEGDGVDIDNPVAGDIFTMSWWETGAQYIYTVNFKYTDISGGFDSTPEVQAPGGTADYVWLMDTAQYRSISFSVHVADFLFADNYTGGLILKMSPINERLGEATNCYDGDTSTYETIGIGTTSHIMHDFGGALDNALNIKKIEWVIDSEIEKSYVVEAWDGGQWRILYGSVSSEGIITPGQTKRYSLSWTASQPMYAVRIRHTGDYKTTNPSVKVQIANKDAGAGTAAYRISRYDDFRDASWVNTTDGIVSIDWSLVNQSLDWTSVWDSSETITSVGKISTGIVLGCENGNVYYYSLVPDDSIVAGDFSLVGSLDGSVNVLKLIDEEMYAGTSSGHIYRSSNGQTWQEIQVSPLPSTPEILSIAQYENYIYFGTDNNRVYSWDPDEPSAFVATKRLSETKIQHMVVLSGILYLFTYPSGKIFSFNGSTYGEVKNTKLTSWGGALIFSGDSLAYAHGDRGTLYRYDGTEWNLFYNSFSPILTDSIDKVNTGPVITDIYEDGVGLLTPGSYKYAVTYVDYQGNESLVGELVSVTVTAVARGAVSLTWLAVPGAKSYNVYRTIKNDQASSFLRKLKSSLSVTEYRDAGSDTITNVQAPSSTDAQMWITASNNKVYIYDEDAIITMDGPSVLDSLDLIVDYAGSALVIGKIDGDGSSRLYKFTGDVVTSGLKSIYVQSKDSQDNISATVQDDIYLDLLYDKTLLEIDENGTLADYYDSQASPPLKLVSGNRRPYQSGTYISEAFYAATLSKWTTLQYFMYIPADGSVDIYVKSSDTKEGLASEDWVGPFSVDGPISEDPYTVYDEFDLDTDLDYYEDYYYSEGDFISSSIDLSLLDGKWIQFKLVMKTTVQNTTPIVYSVVLKYVSNNAVYFFSSLFDIQDMASGGGFVDTDDVIVKRGVLVYNGSIPFGGDIQFGITTDETSRDWQDYQIIDPNKIFELSSRSGKLRVGILLVSTPEEVAVVHEWGLIFDAGSKFVHINDGQYDGPPYVLTS